LIKYRVFIFIIITQLLNTAIMQPIVMAQTQEKTTASSLQNRKFIAALPSGMTVELVGMCEYPSDVNEPWYKPDGSVLDNPPYDGHGSSILNVYRIDSVPVEFAFRLSGNIKQPAWDAQVKTDNTDVVWSGGRRSKNGAFVSNIKSVGMWVKWDQKSTKLHLGFLIDGRLAEWADFNDVSVSNFMHGEKEILMTFFDGIDSEIQKIKNDYPQLADWNKAKTPAGLYCTGKEITGKKLVYGHAITANSNDWKNWFGQNGCLILINLLGSTIETPRITGKTKVFTIKDLETLSVTATVITVNPGNSDLEQKINEIIESAADSAVQEYEAKIEAEKTANQILTKDPNEEMINISTESDFFQLLTKLTGKEVIPENEATNVRITIYAPMKMKKSEAIRLIYFAIKERGCSIEETDDAIYIRYTRPTSVTRNKAYPVIIITDSKSLSKFEDLDQLVQITFKLKNKLPSEIESILIPELSPGGYLKADDDNRSLLVVDTVGNMTKINKIIVINDIGIIGHPAATMTYSAEPNKVIEVLENIFDNGMFWLGSNDSLAEIENKDQLVMKSFGIKYANPSNIMKIISPLINPPGAVISSAFSEDGNSLSVYGIVANLIQVENVIRLFDVETGTPASSQIFDLKYIDPDKAAEIINWVLVSRTEKQLTATFVVPFVETKQLIVRLSSAETMKQIEEWIKRLDVNGADKWDYELVTIKYVDVIELAKTIKIIFEQMSTDYVINPFIEPLPAYKQLLIFGKPEFREMVKKLVTEIDKPISTILN
jgi:hypothetical protein